VHEHLHPAAEPRGAGAGAPRLSSRVQVLVHVSDVNDCPPSITVNSLSPLGLAEVRSTEYTKVKLAPVDAFGALTLLVGRQEGHPACKKTERWGAGVVICLE